MAVRGLFIAAGVAVSQGLFAAAEPSNMCPVGSVPLFECDFAHGKEECVKGANVGVLAPPGGECSVPSPSNGCMLEVDKETLAWMWKSSSTNCCNCFPVKSPCPWGTAYASKCDFNGGSVKCAKGANLGAMAQEGNGLCDVPSPENKCMLNPNAQDAYEFTSTEPNVKCCNCYAVESSPGASVLQAKQQVRSHGRSLRRGQEGDAASMLQLPLEGNEGALDEASDEELVDAEQEEL